LHPRHQTGAEERPDERGDQGPEKGHWDTDEEPREPADHRAPERQPGAAVAAPEALKHDELRELRDGRGGGRTETDGPTDRARERQTERDHDHQPQAR
jgi:hypothetical protein